MTRTITLLLSQLILCVAPVIAAESPLTLDSARYAIPAIISMPDNLAADGHPVPAVVLLHGTASHKNEVGDLYKRLAQRLANKGIASIRIDFAGNGDSSVDYLNYTLQSATGDALVAYHYLQNLKGIDAARIGVLGFSQGGLIAQLVVAQAPEIKTLVAWSSVAGDGNAAFGGLFDALYPEAQANGYAEMKFEWRSSLKLSIDWFEQVKAQTALSDLKKYTGSLLAIAGSEDTVVTPESAQRLMQASGSQTAQSVLIKGGDHIFNVLSEDGGQAEQLLTLTENWLLQEL